MLHPRIGPAEAVLVGGGRIVLLGHVVAEEHVRERLVAVSVAARNVHRDRVLLADVLAEGLARLPVQYNHAGHALHTDEQVVLAALVVVQRADHASPGENEVRLRHRAWERAVTPKLEEPAALVL